MTVITLTEICVIIYDTVNREDRIMIYRGPYQRKNIHLAKLKPYEERYKRSAPGGFFHIFNRGVGRQLIFHKNRDFEFYLNRLEQARKEKGAEVFAYCLMPNHVHLLVKQVGEENVSPFVSSVHTSYAKYFNGTYDRVGHLFQGRYKQVIIQRDEHLRYLIAYIHLNPIEAGLVSTPKQYRWSSWKAYAYNDNDPACDPGQILNIFGGNKQYLVFEKEILRWKKSKRWDKIREYTIE